MKVEELKEQARRHEQREEWQKAFDLYKAALGFQDEADAPDITLFNRVGDIQTRLGQIDGAVEHYEQAIDLYLDAELPNNAIAICKKVLRNLPDRSVFFLRMGQIRASQGFLTDARQNFLAYAERQTARGDVEGALNALVEFVELSPDDVEIRQSLASQLESHDRIAEAIDQYTEVYRRLVLLEKGEEAEAISVRLAELDPGLTLPDPTSFRAGEVEEEPEALVLEATNLGGLDLETWGGGEPVDLSGIELEVPETLSGPAGVEVDEASELDGEVGVEVGKTEEVAFAGLEVGGLDTDALESFSDQIDEDDDELPTFDFDAEELAADAEVISSFESVEPESSGLGTDRARRSDDFLSLIALEDEDEDEDGVEEEELEALPLLGLEIEDVDEAEEAGTPSGSVGGLPLLGFDDEDGTLEAAVEGALEGAFEDAAFEAGHEGLGEIEELDLDPVEEAPAVLLEDHRAAADQGNMELAIERVRAHIEAEPENVELHQRLVEYAFRTNDQGVLVSAYLALAGCLARTGASTKAKAVYQQVLSLSPGHQGATEGLQELDGVSGAISPPSQVASSEEYVDLGAMILGDDDGDTTRWTVPAEAPSGDEAADFAKMLGQFKEKVSEHVAADDVGAHHDLGTAYMEMGLLDEAIAEFQAALRASPDHLPTHEVMGRCWMEMGKPDMAVRALGRALKADFEIEDELIGIYYLMGRAQEAEGNTTEALEFYEKVFSLDINFEDVTERLRALR